VPRRAVVIEDAQQSGDDQLAEAALRGSGGFAQRRRIVRPALRLGQRRLIQARFVAEVIADGPDVGAGPSANLANSGLVKAALGEDFAGGVQESLALGGRSGSCHTKQLFELC